MKRLIWMLAGLLGALPALSQTPLRLTLPEAEAMAVRNNPDVSASLLYAAASNQVTLEVRSAFLPTVNGSVTKRALVFGDSVSRGVRTSTERASTSKPPSGR